MKNYDLLLNVYEFPILNDQLVRAALGKNIANSY
jgi:hypothetical protein